MKFKTLDLIVIGTLCFILGIAMTMIYVESQKENVEKNKFDGLRFETSANHTDALNITYSYDNRGDWVAVNVRGMSYERALEVCKHEVGHEIFAEYCEKDGNIDKCMNLTK